MRSSRLKRMLVTLMVFTVLFSCCSPVFATTTTGGSSVTLTTQGNSNEGTGGSGDTGSGDTGDTGSEDSGDTGDTGSGGNGGSGDGGDTGDTGDNGGTGDGGDGGTGTGGDTGSGGTGGNGGTGSGDGNEGSGGTSGGGTSGGGTSGGGTSGGGTSGGGTSGGGTSSDKGKPSGGTDSSGNKYYLKEGISVSNYTKLNGYIIGKENWTYDPTGYLTRAEFATILVRVFEFSGTKTNKTFDDIQGHWAQEAIEILAGYGVINGISTKEFDPQGTLDIDHVLLMLSRVMYTDRFSTKTSVNSANTHYDKKTISKMVNSGILFEIDDTTDLRVPITREQMVHIINNVIYSRDKSILTIEGYIRDYDIYNDLTEASSEHYKECLKAIDIKYVQEKLGILSKIGD